MRSILIGDGNFLNKISYVIKLYKHWINVDGYFLNEIDCVIKLYEYCINADGYFLNETIA
jgi:hypothetical protein